MRKLIVVDSDRAVQTWIEEQLRQEGFEVSCFDDGLSALDMLSKLDPDLVLADYNLEGMNVFRFCDKLRQKSTSKARPLLLLVNPAESVDQNRLRAAGVVDFIQKPLELQDLLKRIRDYSVEPATLIQKMPSALPVEATQALSGDEMESLKIEELLGWSLPGEKTVYAPREPKPAIKPDFEEDDRTIIETRPPFGTSPEVSRPRESLQAAPPVAPQVPETVEPGPEALPESVPGGEEPAVIAKVPEAPPPPTTFPSEMKVITGTLAEQAKALSSQPPQAEESVVQSPASALGGVEPPLSPQILEATVTQMAREIIEKVAWEVVPTIAEALIKEELEKLKSGESH